MWDSRFRTIMEDHGYDAERKKFTKTPVYYPFTKAVSTSLAQLTSRMEDWVFGCFSQKQKEEENAILRKSGMIKIAPEVLLVQLHQLPPSSDSEDPPYRALEDDDVLTPTAEVPAIPIPTSDEDSRLE